MNVVIHDGKCVIFSGEVDDDWTKPDSEFGVIYDSLADPNYDYFDGGELKKRPDNGVSLSETTVPADGSTPIIMTAATSGILMIDDKGYKIEAGEVELTFDTPGEYRIRLEAFPYLPFETVIHAY